MGIYLVNPDYDNDIELLPQAPVILNQFHEDTGDIDVVKRLMVTEYDMEYIETMPSCGCGRTTGRHNDICEHCGDTVVSSMDRGFHSDTWLKVPPGVEAFIRPNLLGMLIESFTQDKFNAIEWLCNPRYKFEDDLAITFRLFLELEIPRGYNNFVRNFDEILDLLMASKIFKNNPGKRRDTYTCIQQNRNVLFSTYLPLPSKRSIITEMSNKNRSAVKNMLTIVDAARALYAIVGKEDTMPQSRKEFHVYKALTMMIDFRVFVDKKIMGQKEGWYRKQIHGSRDGPTYRGVITSLAGNHRFDEIHLPWGMSIAVYFPHLKGRLMRKGFNPNQAYEYLIKSMSRYDPMIHDLFKQMIAECGYIGLPQLLGRNPTLNLRSIQALYCTEVKTDVSDNTISISVHVLKSCNADFDGDNLGGKPILSHADWAVARRLSPESGLANLNMPGSHTDNMGLAAPVLATINNLMYGDGMWK